MGSISFDGTLPVCSCAYVNICGWKGALLKSFFCLNVWAGFCMCLSVYWRICQEHLRVTKKGKSQVKTERHQCFFFFFFFLHLSTMPSIHLSFLFDNMITLCTCWLQSAYYQTTPDPTTFQCCKRQLFFPIQSCTKKLFFPQLCSSMFTTFMNDSSQTSTISQGRFQKEVEL